MTRRTYGQRRARAPASYAHVSDAVPTLLGTDVSDHNMHVVRLGQDHPSYLSAAEKVLK
jgi:hypothetical protein